MHACIRCFHRIVQDIKQAVATILHAIVATVFPVPHASLDARSARTAVAMKLRVKLAAAPAAAAVRLDVAADITLADFKAIIKASFTNLDATDASFLRLSLNKKASAGRASEVRSKLALHV